MNENELLLLTTIADILLEVNLPEEKKQKIRDAMLGISPVDSETPKPKTKRFEVPAISEVKSHMDSLHVINSEKHSAEFWHFYESKGWMVGKNKMKNWKSAASRWCIELPRGNGENGQKKRIIV